MSTRATVLVVDDEPGHAEMMSEALQKLGVDTIACQSGREALRRLNEAEVDIVVTDLVMRDVGGMDEALMRNQYRAWRQWVGSDG